MTALFTQLANVILYIIAAAAAVGGVKIFRNWNRGDDVLPLILSWGFGIVLSAALLAFIKSWIIGGASTGNSLNVSIGFASDVYNACLAVGFIISIFSVVNIYNKYQQGEEIYQPIFKYLGSILFLASMGWIIESLIN
jgi:Domain of unknown function (DUF4134)